MMALWCEARAAEIAITAVSDAALVHEIKWPHEELSEKAQLQQGRVNSLLPEKLTPASSESEKFLHHENLFRQLQSFQTTSQRGLEKAPESLKSIWHQFNQEQIASAIEATTKNLKENISLLVQQAAGQAERTISLFENKTSAHQAPSMIEASSSTDSLSSMDSSASRKELPSLANTEGSTPASSSQLTREAKTTSENYKTAHAAAEKHPLLLSDPQLLETLQNHQNYWKATARSTRAQQYETQAVGWQQLSREAFSHTKIACLEKASQKIERALASWNKLQPMAGQPSENFLDPRLVLLTQESYGKHKKSLEAKGQEIQDALEESKKPSWTSWFCSFFNMPQWFYFWRTAPVS